MAALPEAPRRPAAGGAAPLPAAARRRAAGRRRVRRAGRACATSDCPGSEVPARYFGYLRGGSPDLLADGPRPQPPGRRRRWRCSRPRSLRLRAGGWRDAPVLDPRGMAVELLRYGAIDGGARGGRGGAGDRRRRSGAGQRAATDGLAAAARPPARSTAPRSCGARPRVAPRSTPPPPGSRWRASASAIAAICTGRSTPRPPRRACSTSPSRSVAAAGSSSSGGSGCGSRSRLRRLRRWVAAADRRAARAPASREERASRSAGSTSTSAT